MRGHVRGHGRRVSVQPAVALHRRADRRGLSVSFVVREEFVEKERSHLQFARGREPVAVSLIVSVRSGQSTEPGSGLSVKEDVVPNSGEVSSHNEDLCFAAENVSKLNAEPL